MPRCAKVTSPGWGGLPPPISPETEIVWCGARNGRVVTTPLDGSHVPLTFGISAAASGPDNASHMQIYVDGTRQADYLNASALPSGTTVTLPGAGVHRVAVQTYDNTKAAWVKSVIYVTNP